MKISEYSVKHPVVIGMILLVLVAFGLFSIVTLNIEFMSPISLPSAAIITIYPGASAEDVEKDVTKIIEDEMVTLPNYKSMTSDSSDAVSAITVNFQDGIDPYEQLEEIRYRLDNLVKDLPQGIQGKPMALVGGADMLPIFTFSVDGGDDILSVTHYVEDELKPQISQLPGVSGVQIYGGDDLQLDVTLRIDDLNARGINVTQVFQAINYGNVTLPVGTVDYHGKDINLRYEGSFNSIEDIRNLPVGMGDDNIVVRLGDIADVRLEYPEKEYYVDSNGNELVVVQVTKRSDGNVVDLSKQIRALLDESERSTGGAVTYRVLSDDSKTTMASLKTVITSGLMGIVMAVLIVLIFLGNVRATIIIGLSIPLSLLFTFIGLKIAGYSINLMTLSGMVIALGMVVDASIVMLEQVYRYYTRKTGKLDDNIIRASDDVGSSIFASGATTIVVFIPIAMLTGIIGSILRQASITIALAIFASLVVAVVIVPFLASKILKPVYEEKKRVRIFDRVMNKIEKGYEFSLNWSMKNRRFILLIAVALLLISLEVLGFLGFSFIPSTDNGDFYVNFEFPQGISLDEARRKVNRAEEIIRAEVPEIESAVFFTGMDSQSFFGINSPTSAYGQIVLVPVAERDRSIQEIILDVQGALAGEIPNCSVSTENGGFDRLVGFVSGGGGYGITLVSEDLMKLYDNAVRIEDFLKDDPSVTVTSMNMSFDASELVIGAVHDYLDSLGVSSYEAGMTTAILFNGVDAGRLTLDGERYGIHLSSDVSERGLDPNSLSDISITSLAGEQISFANISDLRAEQSVNAIHHSDRAKTITISAKLVSEDLSGVTARVDQYLAENPLSDGVKSKQGGIGELVSDSIGPMVIALLTSIFLVYTVMVLQFERFRQPFLILGTIPFTVIGITLGLLAFGSTLNVISMMGVISLSGIVVNNAIILIDCVNQNRKEPDIETEEDLVQSVKAASASRLRPILMTTLTTLLGAIPMAVATGEGSEIYAPLGQAIAGGLLSSTVITLFIIPVLYYLTEKRKLKRRHTDNEEK